MSGSGSGKSTSGSPPAVGLVRAEVAQDVVPGRDVGEVDDHVGALRGGEEEPAGICLHHVVGGGEQAAVVADLVDEHSGDRREVEDQEARVAPVEQAQPVPALVHGVEGPHPTVDHQGVAEELRVPHRGDTALGHERALEAVEERAGVGVEQGAVGVERAVLDRQGDLAVGLGAAVALASGRSGEDSRRSGPRVENGRVAARTTAHDEEPGRAGVDVEPGHPQRVVVVPHGRGAVVVRVVGDRVPGAPRCAVGAHGLVGEEGVPPAVPCQLVGEVCRVGEEPGLRVAVALVPDVHRAVDVRDEGHRPPVGRVLGLRVRERLGRNVRQALEGGPVVGRPYPVLARSLFRVGPVQRGVDREQVRQRGAFVVDELVGPADADGPGVVDLDRERRGMEACGVAVGGRAEAPDRRRRERGREHLLGELAHRDLVGVEVLAPTAGQPRGPGHDAGDHERGREPGDVAGGEGASREYLGEDAPLPCGVDRHEGQRPCTRHGEEGPSSDHDCRPCSGADDVRR